MATPGTPAATEAAVSALEQERVSSRTGRPRAPSGLEANRSAKESRIVHDELIRAVNGARNRLINIDEMSEAEVDQLEDDLRLRAARGSARRD